MNTFRYQRELDVLFLQEKFKGDIFSAREVLGSFVELSDQELSILEAALDQKKYTAFARIAERFKTAVGMVGLSQEVHAIENIRKTLATEGPSDELDFACHELLDVLREKSSLFMIEVFRMDRHIEQAVNQGHS